jgi:endonuclease YncB( thermonuclease family)
MSAITKESSDYEALKVDLLEMLEAGRIKAVQAVNEVLVRTYWKMGKRLGQERKALEEGATDFFQRLAADLGIGSTNLYSALQFYRAYPKGLPKNPDFFQLGWTKHVALLPVRDPDERERYLERALEEGWSRDALRRAIRSDLFGKDNLDARLSGQPGKLDRPDRDLHNYAGIVERVVDGDTLKVRIDLGFDVWRVERIRLRGVDTPELGTPGGKKAKTFVEKTLADAPFVVLRTYKTDRYSRYVADLFYDPLLTTKDKVFAKGKFLNQELLDRKLATRAY